MAKKYASIDFLRGFAIWMMVFVHTLMRWVDRDGIEANLDQYPLIILIILLAAIFFGGWAGFFLMVSAIGNMISMQKSMKRTGKVGDVVVKQIIGGVLLLFCAVLTETITGYHGYLGEIALGRPDKWLLILYRGFHQETIYAVAWCIILNGIVQGLLSLKGGFKKIKRNIRIYLVLAAIVVLMSVPVWMGVDALFPDFMYPMENRTIFVQWPRIHMYFEHTEPIQYGFVGYDSIWMLAKQFFLAPLAGGPEPIFPFLAVSFLGSAIGLWLMRKEEEKEANPDKLPSTRPLSIGLKIGFSVFVVSLVATAVLGAMSPGMNVVGHIISRHYDVRGLFALGATEGPIYALVGFSWFFMETAAQLCAILLLLRVVEFRGKAKQFGRKARYFNRFGMVAFSVYNYQFIDIIAVFIFAGIGRIFPQIGIPGLEGGGYRAIIAAADNSYGVITIWFLIATVYVIHQILLRLWEKTNFTLGFEWFISKSADILVPSKRKQKKREGFFYASRLDAKKALYTPEWIELVPYDKVQHKDLVDSKLAAQLCWVGLVIPPLALVSLGVARTALKTEGKNKYSQRGYIVSIIGICLTIAIIVALFLIPGIAL